MCGLGTWLETLTVTLALAALAALRPTPQRVRAPVADDAAHVLVLLGGQADHEVELHLRPAAREDALGGFEQLLLGDVLVDHVAHALRAGLGREGETGGAHLADLVEHVFVEPVGA